MFADLAGHAWLGQKNKAQKARKDQDRHRYYVPVQSNIRDCLLVHVVLLNVIKRTHARIKAMTLNCFGIQRLIGLKWPLVGFSFLQRVQTGIRDCKATLTLHELEICHQLVKLLLHFGLHDNYLGESRECGIFLEGPATRDYLRVCTNKIVRRW